MRLCLFFWRGGKRADMSEGFAVYLPDVYFFGSWLNII
jgi:hypothetical protein